MSPGDDAAMKPAALAATWSRDLVVTAALGALLLLWDWGAQDIALARLFGNAQGFALREAPWLRDTLHDGGRNLAWVLWLALVVNIWRPWIQGSNQAERVRWVLLTLACAAVVPLIKRASSTSCPWDLAEFGGVAQQLSHWRWGVPDGGPGRCFPSGHATSAFAFLSGYVVLRRSHANAARWWLAAVLLAGVVVGLTQLARGAHFISHTLWSAWVCWVLCVLAAPRQDCR